ncbi:hypothetical protein ENBRE01_0948 [Enteropsectra breve]|nr:hypothetical protein ENBRE01_0948 [Enteropsectra breve]
MGQISTYSSREENTRHRNSTETSINAYLTKELHNRFKFLNRTAACLTILLYSPLVVQTIYYIMKIKDIGTPPYFSQAQLFKCFLVYIETVCKHGTMMLMTLLGGKFFLYSLQKQRHSVLSAEDRKVMYNYFCMLVLSVLIIVFLLILSDIAKSFIPPVDLTLLLLCLLGLYVCYRRYSLLEFAAIAVLLGILIKMTIAQLHCLTAGESEEATNAKLQINNCLKIEDYFRRENINNLRSKVHELCKVKNYDIDNIIVINYYRNDKDEDFNISAYSHRGLYYEVVVIEYGCILAFRNKTDNILAVLCHEIQHNLNNDSLKGAIVNGLLNVCTFALQCFILLYKRKPDNLFMRIVTTTLLLPICSVLCMVLFNVFSCDCEFKADRGIVDTQYAGALSDSLYEMSFVAGNEKGLLNNYDDNILTRMLRTHPSNLSRIENIKSFS